jgi:cell division protein FtsL
MFESEVTLSFIFVTIAVILVCIAIGILYVKKKAKKVNSK